MANLISMQSLNDCLMTAFFARTGYLKQKSVRVVAVCALTYVIIILSNY